jgi:hypothetical protein
VNVCRKYVRVFIYLDLDISGGEAKSGAKSAVKRDLNTIVPSLSGNVAGYKIIRVD